MNISNKLSAIKQSRKRRSALIFHTRVIGGVSVQPEFWSDTLVLIKALFKELKKRQFCIDVNHWGEIILTEPKRSIQIFLSANQSLKAITINEIKNRLSNTDYVMLDELYKTESVQLEFIANRQGAKRHSLRLPHGTELFEQHLSNMVDQILHSVSGLKDTGRPLIYEDMLNISSDDILCVIKYGAIKLGPMSQFAYLLADKRLDINPNFELNDGQLLVKSFKTQVTITLSKPSKNFLANFFPKTLSDSK